MDGHHYDNFSRTEVGTDTISRGLLFLKVPTWMINPADVMVPNPHKVMSSTAIIWSALVISSILQRVWLLYMLLKSDVTRVSAHLPAASEFADNFHTTTSCLLPWWQRLVFRPKENWACAVAPLDGKLVDRVCSVSSMASPSPWTMTDTWLTLAGGHDGVDWVRTQRLVPSLIQVERKRLGFFVARHRRAMKECREITPKAKKQTYH